MNSTADNERLARAALTYLAEPGDTTLAASVRVHGPCRTLAAIAACDLERVSSLIVPPATAQKSLTGWRSKLATVPSPTDLRNLTSGDIQLVCPGDGQWPEQLYDLGDHAPIALWIRGSADLRAMCASSVAVVGSRACTSYGSYVASEIASGLAEMGYTIVSGGAYGIDVAAHRGALSCGRTVAVLASGPDVPSPAGHSALFDTIAAGGAMVSEQPPTQRPTRMRFLARNRIIAALTTATIIVEAGTRSGSMNTARHALILGKPLMAVPGPITSEQSAGSNGLIRDEHATLISSVRDVVAALADNNPSP